MHGAVFAFCYNTGMRLPSNNPITLPFGSTASPYSASNPHKGVDFAPDPDPTVYAPCDMVVILRPNNGNDGNGLYFYNGDQFHGLLHNERYLVPNGATVKEGQPIAIMGFTGYVVPTGSAGRHSHWCVKQNGIFINPLSLITGGKGAGVIPTKETNMIPNQDNYYARYNQAMNLIRGRDVNGTGFSRAEFTNNFVGHSDLTMLEAMSDDPEAERAHEWMKVGYIAQRDGWESQIYGLADKLKAIQAKIDAGDYNTAREMCTVDLSAVPKEDAGWIVSFINWVTRKKS